MKNTTIHKNILTAFTGLFVVSVLVVGAFSLAPLAHAQEDGVSSDGGCACGGSDVVDGYSSDVPSYGSDVIDGYSTGVPSNNGSDVIDGYSTSPASYGSDVVDGYSTYPASYDTGYITGGYSTGYLTTGYLTGGGYLGGSYLAPRTSYIPSGNSNANTNIYAPTQTNTCTAGNSCNTNIVTTTTNNPPAIVYNNPPSYPTVYNYPVCNTCGCPGYSACYRPVVYQNPPVAYTATPYISLSEAPYTGLDLGFWGTIAYWGFLILWCLVAAYLVVVKKVQNRMLRSLNTFLFGDYTPAETPSLALNGASSGVSTSAPVHTYSAPAPVHQVDAIDPFIVSQINRVRA